MSYSRKKVCWCRQSSLWCQLSEQIIKALIWCTHCPILEGTLLSQSHYVVSYLVLSRFNVIPQCLDLSGELRGFLLLRRCLHSGNNSDEVVLLRFWCKRIAQIYTFDFCSKHSSSMLRSVFVLLHQCFVHHTAGIHDHTNLVDQMSGRG